jgi:hypothetical protein
MNFFKHFTDAHEGKSMVALMDQFGIEGYGAYFILMELCMKKLDKPAHREIIEDDCRFVFPERLVRERLRMRRAKLHDFLVYCRDELKLFHVEFGAVGNVDVDVEKYRGSSTEVQLKFNRSATKVQLPRTTLSYELNFYVPKLLEYLDRDSRRARHERATGAPKNKNKEIDLRGGNFEWKDAAQSVSEMLRRYGDWSKDESKIREEIGSDLFEVARAAGTHRMRSLPSNRSYILAMTGMLKEAFEKIKLREIS